MEMKIQLHAIKNESLTNVAAAIDQKCEKYEADLEKLRKELFRINLVKLEEDYF